MWYETLRNQIIITEEAFWGQRCNFRPDYHFRCRLACIPLICKHFIPFMHFAFPVIPDEGGRKKNKWHLLFFYYLLFLCMYFKVAIERRQEKRIVKIEMAIWNEKPPKRCEGSTYPLNSCSQSLRLNGSSALTHWQASTMEPQYVAIFMAPHTLYAMGLISQI